MRILVITVLKNNYRNFVSKFAQSDGRARLKLLGNALLYVPLFFLTALAMPAVAITLKLLEPVFKVRIGKLKFDRIGHLAANTELFLRRQTRLKNANREFNIFISGKTANRQLLKMIKRRLRVLENQILLKLYDNIRPYTNFSKIWIDLPFKGNEYDEFNNVSPQLWFTKEEEAYGAKILTRMGIKEGAPFVCFHARDKAYLDTLHTHHSREKWAYHDYRDADIRKYLKAAEYLASLGLIAVRMGYITEHSIETSNSRIIDYSTHYRSDFGDIYLTVNCKFFFGCTGGLHSVAQAFGVPVAAANWIPIKYALLSKNDLFIPKKLWGIEKKRFLTFSEIIASGMDSWLRSEQYAKAGIEVVENTADEILALVKEMNARLDNTWVTQEEDEELQRRYRSLFQPGHFSYGFPSRIGAEFLRQNRELLE